MSDYPGSIDLAVRAPAGGQDKRTGDQYRAALERETDVSLDKSPSWRDGLPLQDHRDTCTCPPLLAVCLERWSTVASAGLGGRGGRPDKGRWA